MACRLCVCGCVCVVVLAGVCSVVVLTGGRAGALLLEQRVHHVSDRGEQQRCAAHHVPIALPHLEGALEPDDRRARLQRPQDVHGAQQQALRRAHRQLQERAAKVSDCSIESGRHCAPLSVRTCPIARVG